MMALRLTRIFLLFGTIVLTATVGRANEIVAVDYAPLMIKDGGLPGLSIEIIKLAEKRLGVESPVTFMPFPRAIKAVKRRQGTLHPALYRNPQRENEYVWVAKYHVVSNVFLTVGSPVNSLEEARRLKKIGVEEKTAMDLFLTSRGFDNLERTNQARVNASKLAAGRIDAWFLTDILALWTWKQMGMDETLTVGQPISSSDVYIVAGKDFSENMTQKYRDTIEAMLADGTVARIIEKYQ